MQKERTALKGGEKDVYQKNKQHSYYLEIDKIWQSHGFQVEISGKWHNG